MAIRPRAAYYDKRGYDAGLAGASIRRACPYHQWHEASLWWAWVRGWQVGRRERIAHDKQARAASLAHA